MCMITWRSEVDVEDVGDLTRSLNFMWQYPYPWPRVRVFVRIEILVPVPVPVTKTRGKPAGTAVPVLFTSRYRSINSILKNEKDGRT
jgi:hypothetical protein